MKKWRINNKELQKMTKLQNKFAPSLISQLIYPNVCGICGRIDNNSLCKKCELLLKKEAKFVVEENLNKDFYFNNHLYIFKYDGIIRKLLLNYKFNEKAYLYKTFVNFLLKNQKFFEILNSYDTIVSVPISKKRKNERGYNQSDLIARELSRRVSVKYNSTCIIKIKDVIAQSKLSKEEREKNIKGIYKLVDKRYIENKTLLLVDDVYTTGSTVNECCKTLLQANVKNIDVLTISKD